MFLQQEKQLSPGLENLRAAASKLLWLTTERVHFAFGNKLSPVGYMLSLPRYELTGGRECKDGWPYALAGASKF
jgi:hypothetical protein